MIFKNIRFNIKITGYIVILLFAFGRPAFPSGDEEVMPGIEKIVINNDSTVRFPHDNMIENVIFRHNDNNIRVWLKPSGMAYQFFLDGFDRDWSEWLDFNVKEYTNLPSGKYDLRVRYTDRNQTAGEMSLIKFKILPVWYGSVYAIVFYVLFGILLLRVVYYCLRLHFAGIRYRMEQDVHERTEALMAEKDNAEKLLENILPKKIVGELMEKGKASKTKYDFVTVLFSDIQGFTKMAEGMDIETLIDELDKFFLHLDSIADTYGIEKIKTIGDAYMCAGGIPEKNHTNPVDVVLAAFEIQDYMNKLKEESARHWDIRIGIHTGTIVAGVVGCKKLSYDIWGDTVNTARRMESSGEAGEINISETTYELVKDFFLCEYRGKKPVKDKGNVDMYFVKGILPELCDNRGKPNDRFSVKLQKIKLYDVRDMVMAMFEEEAPRNLYFHNTFLVKDICNRVALSADAENLGDSDFISLSLASMFLFTGYISCYDNPKEASCRKVEEILPEYGFDRNVIASVKRLIENSFSNIRNTLSDDILHDARYAFLKDADLPVLMENLFREMAENGKPVSSEERENIENQLLETHGCLAETGQNLS